MLVVPNGYGFIAVVLQLISCCSQHQFNNLKHCLLPQWFGGAVKHSTPTKTAPSKENKHVLDYHSSIYMTANIFSTLSLVFFKSQQPYIFAFIASN